MFGGKFSIGRAASLLGLAGALTLSFATLSIAQSYNVTDLGYIGGTPKATNPEGLSSDGQVTGYSYVSGSSVYNAFLFEGGPLVDLGALVTGSFSIGTSVNDFSDVVGYGTLAQGGTHAFLVSNGVMTDLGTLPGGTNSIAYAINNNGQIVGYSSSPNSGQRAVIFANGTVTDIGALNDFGTPGAGISIAHAINNKGQIAGWSYNFDTGSANGFSTHAFLFTNGVMKDIGGITAMGAGLNDNGIVVGTNTFPDGEIHGVRFDGSGGYTDLGNLKCVIQDPITFLPGVALACFNGQGNSAASAINNFSQIVGNSDTQTAGLQHAFLFLNGSLRDLNWYIPANSGWVLQTATAINDAGQIVGNGTHNGVRAGYLLTPNCATDLSANVSVVRGGFSFNPVVHKFGQLITITNTSSVEVVGPIKIAIDNLSAGSKAVANTGITSCNAPLNSPYYQLNVTLGPGGSTTTSFVFDDPTKAPITYQTRVLGGAGLP
jgi:probable HAF family extracellular repeat protein